MDDQDYQALLKRYLNGDVTAEERAALDAWYDALDERSQTLIPESQQLQLMRKNWNALHAELLLPKSQKPVFWKYAVAACAAVLVFASIFWFSGEKPKSAIYEFAAATNGAVNIEKTNGTDKPMDVILSDKSVISLEPGAKIRYPEQFSGQRREVILEGDAFFKVTKDAAKPFIVYAGEVVTKVLGTSFRVSAGKSGNDVTVAVKTGRVSVFSPNLTSQTEGSRDPETGGVVLTPNQQVVFMAREQRLVKTLVENPDVVLPSVAQPKFIFDNAPVDEIFKKLEQAYGVTIVYDETLLSNCRVTTSMEDENLYSKLKIICTLLNASYKIIDAQIVIDSKGC
ncbi:FecR family protein [Dyadobacter sp. CY323]|uniref:FecR family protein n=1 Tax=Dyadobacter sp. CY323 TaxID=2907302 RepID=UPI001F17F18F|nr:FecR family protein [Dyadobacter sp. CY323]MCE6989613.1 FecR domain-containing protein [Dyadobacter sp. CY323]